jgi:hypothetical protein
MMVLLFLLPHSECLFVNLSDGSLTLDNVYSILSPVTARNGSSV